MRSCAEPVPGVLGDVPAHKRNASGNAAGIQVTGGSCSVLSLNAHPSYMAFYIHKPLHSTDNERVVEALQLLTQTVTPCNARNEALGLNDLLQ